MRIDYRICDKWADSYLNLSRAGKTEFRCDVGLGDVILRFDQIHLSAKRGWIPLIDFALALDDIASGPVKEDGPAIVGFAELDAISKELQERYPDLARNQTFQELFAVWNG